MTISTVSKQYGLSPDTLRYYEKIGMIPPVNRTNGGLRDYTEYDCGWIELAKCMRSAGLPIEVMVEYVRLTMVGDSSIPARHQLLIAQRKNLINQQKEIKATLERLNYKIGRYQIALETGKLSWEHEEKI